MAVHCMEESGMAWVSSTVHKREGWQEYPTVDKREGWQECPTVCGHERGTTGIYVNICTSAQKREDGRIIQCCTHGAGTAGISSVWHNMSLSHNCLVKGTVARDFFLGFFHGSTLYWAQISRLKVFSFLFGFCKGIRIFRWIRPVG